MRGVRDLTGCDGWLGRVSLKIKPYRRHIRITFKISVTNLLEKRGGGQGNLLKRISKELLNLI